MPVKHIGKTTIRVFELLHSTSSALQQIRVQKYSGIVSADSSKVDSAFLLPGPRTALYHGPRVYQQIKIRKQLSDVDNDPPRCGWVMEKNSPIMTDIDTDAH